MIVLTKSDLVEAEWLAEVSRDVRALVADTGLANAPVVAFSAVTGAGHAGVARGDGCATRIARSARGSRACEACP